MSYNEQLGKKIRLLLHEDHRIEEKKMFGGIGFLLNGNMCLGVHKDFLVLRISPRIADELLTKPNMKPFDITGRPMRGWVMIHAEDCPDADLHEYIKLTTNFAATLEPK